MRAFSQHQDERLSLIFLSLSSPPAPCPFPVSLFLFCSFFVCFWAGSCCVNFSASKLRQPLGLWCHRPALPHLAPVSRTRFVKLFGLLLISSPHMIQYAPCGYKLWSCSRKTMHALWLVSMVSLLVLDTKGQAEYCSPFLSFNILIISYQ